MLSLQFGLLAAAVIPCLAHPTIQITLHDVPATHVSIKGVSASTKWNVDDVLSTVQDFQKNASAIGKAAAAFPAFPSDDVPEKEWEDWFDTLVNFNYLLKNQTANAKSLETKLEENVNEFNVDDSVKLMKSLIKFVGNLNSTELDPLVQFSDRTFKNSTSFRDLFFDYRFTPLGGLVGWSSALEGALDNYVLFLSKAKDFPQEVDDLYFETLYNGTWAIRESVKAFRNGKWPEYDDVTLRRTPVSLKGSL